MPIYNLKYPFKICCNPVAKNHMAIQCDKCQLWIHIKYNKKMSKLITFYKKMKQPGTAYLDLKIYFLSLALLTMISIQQFKVKK